MLDFSNFPTQSNADIQDFYGLALEITNPQMWTKPRGARMVSIMLIGSGGGGGNQTTFGVSTAGGGGGGSSGVSNIIVPAMFLPDVLYVNLRGTGAAGNTVSSRGNCTVALTYGTAPAANEVVLHVNNGQRAGAGATGSAGGASTMASACLAGLGVVKWSAGNAGGSSTAAAAGGSGLAASGGITIAGGGGGGTGVAAAGGNRGGHNTGNSIPWPDVLQQAGGSATSDGVNGGWGGAGKQVNNIPVYYGATGGNSSGTTAPASRGGDGGTCSPFAFGAGGGGAGAGFASAAASGGSGGGAFCRIMSW